MESRLMNLISDISSFIGQSTDSTSPLLPFDFRQRSSFLKRVHSFQSSTWFAKPKWLSPVICARYGWINTDVDVLCCTGCSSLFIAHSPKSFDPVVYGACRERFENQLRRDAHHPCCTWPSCPTVEAVVCPYRNFGNVTSIVKDFTDQCHSLCALGASLPAIDFLHLKLTDSDVQNLCDLVRRDDRFIQLCLDIPGALKSAIALALVGWKPEKTSVLKCSVCLREVGLWNYFSVVSRMLTQLPEEISSSSSCHDPVEDITTHETGVYEPQQLNITDVEPTTAVHSCVETCLADSGSYEIYDKSEDSVNSQSIADSHSLANSEDDPVEQTETVVATCSTPAENIIIGMDDSPGLPTTADTEIECDDMTDTNFRSSTVNDSTECDAPKTLSDSCEDENRAGDGDQSSAEVQQTDCGLLQQPTTNDDRVTESCSQDGITTEQTTPEVCTTVREYMTELLNDLVEKVLNNFEQNSAVDVGAKRHASGSPASSPTPKRTKIISSELQPVMFNPISEHQTWCPYVCSLSDCGFMADADSQGTPPWIYLLRILVPDPACSFKQRVQTRPMPEGIDHIRKTFRSWTSAAQIH